jgi:acyl-CoA synthetase (NDP forming)
VLSKLIDPQSVAVVGASTTYEMYYCLFQQAGVIETSSVREMFDVAKALATQPMARGGRVLVVTDSDGMGI